MSGEKVYRIQILEKIALNSEVGCPRSFFLLESLFELI
jgi:hypothetical protein